MKRALLLALLLLLLLTVGALSLHPAQAQDCWYQLYSLQDDGSITPSGVLVPCPDPPRGGGDAGLLPLPTLPPILPTLVVATATPNPPTPTATATMTPSPVATSTKQPPPTVAGLPTSAPPAPTRTPNPNGKQLGVGQGQTYQTISAAAAVARPGDTVLIHAGTYPEQVDVKAAAITIRPAGDGPVWIDAECQRPHGITLQQDDGAVYGIGVKRSLESTILVANDNGAPARAIIEDSTLQDFNCADTGEQLSAGIASYYAGPGHRFVSNTITRRVEVDGLPQGQGNGIWIKSSTANPGGNHYIARNVITGGWDGIGGEVENDPHGAFDHDTTIEDNTISSCADDGIQIDGGGQRVFVQRNKIRECGMGVSFAPVLTGPAYVLYNEISSATIGLLDQLACFKVGNDSPASVIVVSNDCGSFGQGRPNTGKGVQQTNGGSNVLTFRANRFTVDAYVFEFSGIPRAGSSFDGDCMDARDPGRFAKYGGTVYTTLAAFTAATGQEKTGRLGPC